MQKTKIAERIYAVIGEHLNVSKITPNMSLKSELALDSMDMLELSMKLEDEFCLPREIADEISWDSINTVHDLVNALITAMDSPMAQKIKRMPYILHEERKYKIYCGLTNKKCRKIRGFNPGEDPCLASDCKLAQNFYNIVSQKQR